MYEIIVLWNNQSVDWWNEIYADVLEVFGLPGHRFVYTPYTNFMIFKFNNQKDHDLCQILLSEKL